MPLPTFLVVGAMKCGTTALHTALGLHPDVDAPPGKELNFFVGDDHPGPGSPAADPEEDWRWGRWHRGPGWYAAQFGDAPVRGEASPAYSSPTGGPVAAPRIAALLPDVRLVALVRDPLARAVSQWRHHVRDGTEPRPLADALLDPGSEYLARSRYDDRLAPLRTCVPGWRDQLLVVVQERLRAEPRREVARVLAHVGADPGVWDERMADAVHVGAGDPPPVPRPLADAVREAVADDVARLRERLGDELPEWG